jgi:hypothetical protein
LALMVAVPGEAAANMTWCVSDPPIQVVTPAGHIVTVNNMVYIAQSESRFGNRITDSATAASNPAGGTLVMVRVNLPQGISQARITSSVYRFKVSSQAVGTGGTTVILYLNVPIT